MENWIVLSLIKRGVSKCFNFHRNTVETFLYNNIEQVCRFYEMLAPFEYDTINIISNLKKSVR